MLSVAITGNIGGGKSTVAHFLQNLGIPLFSADKAGHEVLQKQEVIEKLQTLFGDAIFDETGALSRKNIAAIVFSDEKKLQKLNAITHPEIKAMIADWIENQDLTSPYLLVEAAVLFEAGFDALFDKIITVAAPEALRIERVVRRDGATPEAVLRRVRAQMPETEKIAKSDFVIVNDGREAIIPQILKIHEALLKRQTY